MSDAILKKKYLVTVSVTDLRREPVAAKQSYGRDFFQETQLLYGEKVLGGEARDGWLYVEAVEQMCCNGDGRWTGYPGWVRCRHLTAVDAFPEYNLVVSDPWADIVTEDGSKIPVTLGTRLYGREQKNSQWTVVLQHHGGTGKIAAASVQLIASENPSDQSPLLTIGDQLVGHPYLWGGRSVFRSEWSECMTSVDCSALVQLLYRLQGLDLPRDAHDQHLAAAPVAPEALQVGDLVFKIDKPSSKRIDHVMIYGGDERLLEASMSAGCVQWITFREKLGLSLEEIVGTSDNPALFFGRPRTQWCQLKT